ncbi:MAG: TolC family protein [Arachidicoccus sp.]|nr:TolC family protein [Arachidicoccus sp.]
MQSYKSIALRYVLYTGIFLYSKTLYAQSSQIYSLKKLIELSEKYTPSIRQSEAFANAATAHVTDVKHEQLPFLKFNAQASLGSANAVNGNYFPMGVVPSTSGSKTVEQNNQPVLGDLATLYSEYDVYNFGLNRARNENAEAEALLGKTALEKDKYQLKIELAKLYFNILTYQNLREIDEKNVNRYATIDTIIQSLAHAGIKPGADLSQANAELANAKIKLNKTKAKLQEALQTLSAYAGISVDSLNINNRILDSTVAFDNLIYDSTDNPILNYYKSNNDYLATNALLLKKSYLPKFTLIVSAWGRASSLNLNLQTEALSKGLGFQRYNYAAGIAFVYDFMDVLHKKDKLAEYKYEMQAGQEAYNQQKLNFDEADAQANLQLKLVMDNLQQLSVQRKSAHAVYADKEAQYKAGMVTLIDLTNASFVLYRSQVDYLDAIDNWYAASLSKAIATGNLDNFIQSIN